MKKFREYQPKQIMLMPPSIDEWLPANHLVYFIDEVVDNLDLSMFYQAYQEPSGQPPYNPRMMVKILIYAVTRGTYSSRKIEKALYEDIGFRIISANQQPDHWTISEFRRRHKEALSEIFIQTIELADKAGLIKLKHIAIDRTKIKANASKHSAMSYGYMIKEEERLQKEINDILDEMERIDQEEDKKYGKRRGDELPDELSTREKRLEAIKRAKAELEAEAKKKLEKEQNKNKEKAEKEGKSYKPRKKAEEGKPREKDQYNFTDPDSRVMKNSDKAFIQAYNGQSSVDGDTHIILAADVTNEANDKQQIEPQIKQIKENTRKPLKEVEISADAGYFSENNIEILAGEEAEALIPPDKIKHSEWRSQKSPRGPIPKDATVEDLMRRKLKTKRGKERYKLRQTSIEPVFGYIKQEFGLRQFLVRGLDNVRATWRFTCAVHNLMKIYRAGVRYS